MKEQILTALKSKYSDLGLGDAVLESFATMLAGKITDEKDIEQQVEGISDVLKVFQSASDKNRTENQKLKAENAKLKTQVEGFKNDEKDEKKTDEQSSDKKDNSKDEEIPSWAKKLEERLNKIQGQLEERVNTLQGSFEHEKEQNLLERRTQEVQAIIGKLPEGLRKPYTRIELQSLSEEDYAALKQEIAEEVSTAVNELSVKGASFKPPMRGNDNGVQMSKEKADAIAKRLVNR